MAQVEQFFQAAQQAWQRAAQVCQPQEYVYWWHPEKLQRQVALLAQLPALGYVLSHMHAQQETTTPWPVPLNQAHYQNDPACVLPSALLARREIFQQMGEFDVHYRYRDDADWFLRAKDAGVPMAIVPEPLVYKCMFASGESLMTMPFCFHIIYISGTVEPLQLLLHTLLKWSDCRSKYAD